MIVLSRLLDQPSLIQATIAQAFINTKQPSYHFSSKVHPDSTAQDIVEELYFKSQWSVCMSSTRQIVFIDGVGGKRYMRGKFVRYFERRGYTVRYFDYRVSSQPLDEIKKNLIEFLSSVARAGAYHAVGYSFGGVLLRSLNVQLREHNLQPERVVLLASPLRASRLASRLRDWKIYRAMTGECGQFAADEDCMNKVPMLDIPTAHVYGTWPWLGAFGLFFGFGLPHDGMVAADEAIPSSLALSAPISASHAFIPSNDAALKAIEQCLTVHQLTTCVNHAR
ncbi:MAG: hypothetical protein WA071_23270 [Undibacterium umbellatum]|uniref:esterase/lipase family protein n=1 Tax=Undibacterium umbellatum TaxID=2762300 RepID=UPI003BB76BF8